MKNKVDILSFTYSSKGRDIDIVEPVLSKLELELGVIIKRCWLYDNFVFDILRYKPKMLILANAIGCHYHFWAAKFASMLGIKVVTFVSEGDYRYINGSITTMLYGWNKEEHLYEDLHLEWSQRNINYFSTSPSFDENIVKLSGATGFDKYKLLKFLNKNDFLMKYDLGHYEKIVGLGGWTFDFAFNENHSTGPIFFGKELDGIKASLFALREGYRALVTNNPDILFICKKHPLTINEYYDEFSLVREYPNVITLQTEENIYDLINVSDLWITFDSTTALEAWLLGKTTLLYNPVIQDFNRSSIMKGSPILTTPEMLIDSVKKIYENNRIIDAFSQKENERNNIIKEVIAFCDGKNYLRAADLITSLYLGEKKKKEKVHVAFILKMGGCGIRNFLRNLVAYSNFFDVIPRVRRFKNTRLALYNEKEREYYRLIYKEAITND